MIDTYPRTDKDYGNDNFVIQIIFHEKDIFLTTIYFIINKSTKEVVNYYL